MRCVLDDLTPSLFFSDLFFFCKSGSHISWANDPMKRTVLVRDIRVLKFDQRDEGACFTGRGGQKKKVADADSSAKLALISTSSPYIFHPYLQCFCWSDSPKTRPYNQGFLWSHLTIILDTKSTALTGTGCQIKPFNDKFSPKVSWEISSGLHCGKKKLWTWHWT